MSDTHVAPELLEEIRVLQAERDSLREENVRLREAAKKALAGIGDWRLGAQYKDEGEYRQMTAAESYLRSVRQALEEALLAPAPPQEGGEGGDQR